MSFRRRLTAIGQWVAAGQQRDLASGFRRNEQRRRKKSIYFILMILSLGA
jgi:hypothetical protein